MILFRGHHTDFIRIARVVAKQGLPIRTPLCCGVGSPAAFDGSLRLYLAILPQLCIAFLSVETPKSAKWLVSSSQNSKKRANSTADRAPAPVPDTAPPADSPAKEHSQSPRSQHSEGSVQLHSAEHWAQLAEVRQGVLIRLVLAN